MNQDYKEKIMMSYKMYSLVLRHLSPIQKGIQSAHSIVEYSISHDKDAEYLSWSRTDKTIIVLDVDSTSEMFEIKKKLTENFIPFSEFREGDLGNIVTSISILVDERVYDKEKYPDYETWVLNKDDNDPILSFTYETWLNEVIGNKKNVLLRELLMNKRLAR